MNRPSTQFVRSHQKGLTLVELMISMVIGLLLLGGISQIYMSSRQTYRMQDNLSRIQENARFAMGVLTQEIRMAGYQGCPNMGKTAPAVSGSGVSLSVNTSLMGYEVGSSWAPTFSSVMPDPQDVAIDDVIEGTSVLSVIHGQSCGAYLLAKMADEGTDISIDAANSCGFKDDDLLMVSDCAKAEIFSATIDGGTITHGGLENSYDQNAQVIALSANEYYIKLNNRGNPALYRRDNQGGSPEKQLSEGVYDMQLRYGEKDITTGNTSYLDADSIGNWHRVTSVRITLDIRSNDDNLAPTDSTYTFNGASTTDHRLRRSFTTTVNIRNRVL